MNIPEIMGRRNDVRAEVIVGRILWGGGIEEEGEDGSGCTQRESRSLIPLKEFFA